MRLSWLLLQDVPVVAVVVADELLLPPQPAATPARTARSASAASFRIGPTLPRGMAASVWPCPEMPSSSTSAAAPCGSPIPTTCSSSSAARRSSTWPGITWPSATASSERCTSARRSSSARVYGAESPAIYQKRVPQSRPDWLGTVRVRFPSGRHADELCVTELAHVIWAVNLATLDFHPWPSRRAHVDRPHELRIDSDPQPGTTFADAKRVAAVVREVLGEIGYTGWPKTP